MIIAKYKKVLRKYERILGGYPQPYRKFSMKYTLDWKLIGQRLKERRKELGYTQMFVGDFIFADKDDSGACPDHARTVVNHESGQPCKIHQLLKYCEILECDIDYLLGNIDLPTREITDINKEIGLSEKAIQFLRQRVPDSDGYTDILNYTFEEALDNPTDSFLRKMFDYYFDEIDTILYRKNKWFPWFDKKFRERTPDFSTQYDYLNLMYDLFETLDEFKDKLQELGYSSEEAEKVRRENSPIFSHYYELIASETFRKINLQSSIIRHLDGCVSKFVNDYELREKDGNDN